MNILSIIRVKIIVLMYKCPHYCCVFDLAMSMCLNWTQQYLGHLYSSGMWLGADVRTNTIDMCYKEIGLHAQNVLTVLASLINIIRAPSIWPLNEHENVCVDNE